MSQSDSPQRQRRHLHFDALIQRVRQRFEVLPEQRRCPSFPLADALMAGLALFSLKDPSLLAFCGRALDHNLRSVFGLKAIPSDTQMREILDEVAPNHELAEGVDDEAPNAVPGNDPESAFDCGAFTALDNRLPIKFL